MDGKTAIMCNICGKTLKTSYLFEKHQLNIHQKNVITNVTVEHKCHICLKILPTLGTVWSEEFLYKVASPELKNSPIMYFVIHNSVVLSKILKIVVPFWLLFVYVDYYQNNQFYRVKNWIFKILLLWHNNFQYFG